jgi:ferredoxin-type protein NapF
MDSLKARRAFLLGRAPTVTVIRPPWSLPEQDFLDRCTRCNDCVKACPSNIIITGDGGFPRIDFPLGECTFCGECVRACTAGAFNGGNDAPWQLQIAIDDSCLAKHDIFCMACVDACPAQAIRLHYAVGVPTPQVDTSACTGCGGCVAICPAHAISLHPCEATATL